MRIRLGRAYAALDAADRQDRDDSAALSGGAAGRTAKRGGRRRDGGGTGMNLDARPTARTLSANSGQDYRRTSRISPTEGRRAPQFIPTYANSTTPISIPDPFEATRLYGAKTERASYRDAWLLPLTSIAALIAAMLPRRRVRSADRASATERAPTSTRRSRHSHPARNCASLITGGDPLRDRRSYSGCSTGSRRSRTSPRFVSVTRNLLFDPDRLNRCARRAGSHAVRGVIATISPRHRSSWSDCR